MEQESLAKQETKTVGGIPIGLLRMIEATVNRELAMPIATLQLLLHDQDLPPATFDQVYRSELACRGVSVRISTLVELYGGEDAAGALRMASYDIDQFFTVIAEQMNKALGHKLKGDIFYRAPDYRLEQTVTFDARRVSMILYHLVANAIQHGKTENKNVELRADITNGVFEMSVRDHGGGIPKEKAATLFTGFTEAISQQALETGLFPPGIRGVGLPLCRKLAEEMAGEIKFRNFRNGAIFTVLLPQKESRFRETSVFLPDDTLLKNCMASLLKELGENKPKLTEIGGE